MGEDVNVSGTSGDVNRYIGRLIHTASVLALAGYRVTVLHNCAAKSTICVFNLQMIPTEVTYTTGFGSHSGVSYVECVTNIIDIQRTNALGLAGKDRIRDG